MRPASVDDWLRYQASLNAAAIELGLERVREVGARLDLRPPGGSVFTIAGTNGKGSCAALLDRIYSQAGFRVAVYTSPHLCRYNERIRVAGESVTDTDLVDAFNRIEDARNDVPLTYFEFGTLAALMIFSRARADVWVLEVGLGGRLDAVNMVDADYALIPTVGLDHQRWLGETIEAIAAEKAGIMRPGKFALYGDTPVPAAITSHAEGIGARLLCFGRDFDCSAGESEWQWQGLRAYLCGLPKQDFTAAATLRNSALVLTAVEQHSPGLLTVDAVKAALEAGGPAGRFQLVDRDERQWILDVAHNPQAAGVLREQLSLLPRAEVTTFVLGMLATRQPDDFLAELAPAGDRWIACAPDDPGAQEADSLRAAMEEQVAGPVDSAASLSAAFEFAERVTPPGGRIVVCGSFHVVGPALEWLGLYSAPSGYG